MNHAGEYNGHPGEQPLEMEKLLQRCMGEIDFARMMLQRFLDSGGAGLDDIRSGIDSGDADGVAKKTHRLKGTAATIAARPLCRSLETLERAARSEAPDLGQMREDLEAACQEFRRLEAFLLASPERTPACERLVPNGTTGDVENSRS